MIIATTFTVYRQPLTTLPKYTIGSVPGHCLHVYTCYVLFFFFFFFFFRVVVFSLEKRGPIAMIFDDAIYLFIYFLHFISMLLRPSPILKTI